MSIEFSPRAAIDIDVAADYLEAEREGSGHRFRDDLIRLLTRLEILPLSAELHEPPNPKLPGLRCAQLSKFRKYCVFYQPTPEGILVVRCINGMRNISAVLESDE